MFKREEFSYCPLVRGECKKRACKFYSNIQGENPQTGARVDQWDCVIALLPLLMVETSRLVNFNIASTDKVANQVLKSTQTIQEAGTRISKALLTVAQIQKKPNGSLSHDIESTPEA